METVKVSLPSLSVWVVAPSKVFWMAALVAVSVPSRWPAKVSWPLACDGPSVSDSVSE